MRLLADFRIEKTGGFLNSPIVPDSRNLFVTSQRSVFSFIHNHNINLCIIENKTKDFQFGVPWPNKYYWHPISSRADFLCVYIPDLDDIEI